MHCAKFTVHARQKYAPDKVFEEQQGQNEARRSQISKRKNSFKQSLFSSENEFGADLTEDVKSSNKIETLITNKQSGFVSIKVQAFLLAIGLLLLSLTSYATTNVFIVSNSLDKANATKTLKSAITLLTQMDVNDKLVVYDGFKSQIVMSANLSRARRDSAKAKLFAVKNEIASLKRFLSASVSENPTGRLLLPQTVKEFGLAFPLDKSDVRFLVVGSPMYHDDSSESSLSFSMEGGYIPSDGHLRAKPQESPFAVVQKHLHQLPVHFLSTYNGWVDNTYHKKHVHRFWDLWVSESGGVLDTFTNDLDTGFQRFLNSAKRECIFLPSVDT